MHGGDYVPDFNWRASVASETLTGRGNTIENRGCLFIGERA